MKPTRPCTSVFHAVKGKTFFVFTMGMAPTGQTLLDGPTEIADREFDIRIEAALMEALNFYQGKVAADRVWHAPEGMRDFMRKHLCVEVERVESGNLQVFPLHHEGSGYVGTKGEQIIVPAADVHSSIALVLRNAFAVAS